jgi:hypothetical protein
VVGILAAGMQGVQNDGEGQQASMTKTTLTGGDIDDQPRLGEVVATLMRWAREASNADKASFIIKLLRLRVCIMITISVSSQCQSSGTMDTLHTTHLLEATSYHSANTRVLA